MQRNEKIRKPAVAGAFYPLSPQTLRGDVEKYLADAAADTLPQTTNIIIAPHAGYVFSAPVAARAYSRVSRDVNTVFLIGPSHRKWFDGIHLTDVDFYETPLGSVRVNRDIVAKLSESPLCVNMPGVEEDEHCLEVQIPFLQLILKDGFTIVPIHVCSADVREVAETLSPFIDDKTLVVASSDLSHYKPQDQARETDDATIHTIVTGDINGFMDGCGETAMRTVMYIAAEKGLRAEVIDARTSFETAPQYGDSNRVVGYAAVAFVKAGASVKGEDDFSDDEKKYLLELSRKTLESAVYGKGEAVRSSTSKPPFPKLSQCYGCFVTLNMRGHLRGCIGNIEPIRPLCRSVIENTINAAFHDPRFPQVTSNEVGDIDIEISILTRPQPLDFDSPDDLLSKLIPFEHGVILKFGGSRQSTFLPQVWEQLPDRSIFLEHLSMKAGMGAEDWKKAEVWTYRAVHFSEPESQ